MNQYVLIALILSTLSLIACDKPTIVNIPATEVVPGPPGATGKQGAQGETGVKGNSGDQGETGVQGDTGKSGDSTAVIVIPPEKATPANE